MWNNFDVSSTDEYTVNNVFCSNGLFKISNNEAITENPNVYASVHNQKMLLAIDKSLVLLEDESINACRQLSFDATIDCLTISQSGNIIICALQNGNIAGVFIKGHPIFQLMINDEDIRNDRTFVNIHQVDEDFYIMCSSGTFYKLSNIDEDFVITQFGSAEDTIIDTSLINNVSLDRIIRCKYSNPIDTSCLVKKCTNIENLQFTIVNSTKHTIHFYNSYYKNDCKINIPSEYNGIKKIFNLDHLLIGLNNKGELFEICPYTKTIKNLFENSHNKFIDDLVIMESNDDYIDLLLLTKYSESHERVMKIVEFPSMKCKYELPMMKNCWLVDQEKCSIQLYYVSGDQCDTDFIQEIEMNILSETQPLQRLNKLIKKGHLDEAEEFAKQFSLSVQPINEAKVRKIIVEIKTKQFSIENLKIKINELFNLLNKIDNKLFIISLNTIEIPDRQLMETFLKHLLKLIEELNIDNEHQDILNDINERILRMETLNIIDPFQINQNWHEFVYQSDLIKTCTEYFISNLSISCLIWGRHASSIVPFLDNKRIITLLNAIPESTDSVDIIQWLRHVTPNVLQTHPDIMTTLIDWSIQKTKKLQTSTLWPEIGLEFINEIYKIFDDVKFLLIDINRKCKSNMEKLKTIIFALEALAVLKSSYDLTLTLDDYIKDSLNETAFSLLQRIQLNNLKSLVNNFLYPIFMEKGLTPVESIVRYINLLINKRKNISAWQERSVECIELLHNEEEKLKCVVHLLKVAPVPWSDTIKPLIKYGASNHSLAKEIFNLYESQKIKMLRIKYGWDANSTDDSMKLVFRIIKIKLDGMIDDIKEVINAIPRIAFNANIYCCYELARTGDLDNSYQYFKSLDNINRDITSEHLINMLTGVFDDDDINNKDELKNLLEILKLISVYTNKTNQNIIKTINCKFVLKNFFNMNVKITSLLKSTDKLTILTNGIDIIIDNINKNKYNKDILIQKIWQAIVLLTNTLELENLLGLFELCKRFDNIYLTCSMGLNILNLIDINNYNIEHLIDIVILLIKQQMVMCARVQNDLNNPATFEIAYELLYQGLKIKYINSYEILELCSWLRIGTNICNINIINSNDELLKLYEQNLIQCVEHEKELPINNVIISKNKRETITTFDIKNIVKKAPVDNVRNHDFDEVLKCISLAMKICITEFDLQMVEPYSRLYNNYSYLFNNIIVDDLKNEFLTLINQLLKLKFHSSVYDILQLVRSKQIKMNKLFLPASFLTTINKKILKFMLLQKEPMFIDAVTILLSDEDQIGCINYLKNDLKSGSGKVTCLRLTEMYYDFKDNKQKVKEIRSDRLKYYYFNELCKNDTALKLKSNLEFISINSLIKELQNKVLDVTLLEKLSTDFNWNFQEVLISQVITILNMQKLEFDTSIDILGKEEIIIKTSIESIIDSCMIYINQITDIDLFSQKLTKYVTEINFYFYELYLCVIQILSDINKLPSKMELWKGILLYLKHKMTVKRRKNPSQAETDWWLKSHADIGVLPKISKYRFPFMPIINIPDSLKTLLDDEISVENCENWFTLIHYYTSLDEQSVTHESIPMHDYFCMSAVKNSTTEYKLLCDNNQSDVWHLKQINNSFLQSILCLIQHMKDLSNISFLLYFVTNHAPEGIDQVEAAYECYKFSVDNKNELIKSERAKEIVEKIGRKYPIIKIQHLLHVYSLTDDKLMQLVECPKDLIHSLYMHEIILNERKPDINKLAKEIADVHDINLYQLQIQLLHKWLSLSSNTLSNDLEETFYDDNTTIENDSCNFESNIDELIVRAHYILGNWEIQQSIQFLITHIFPVDGCVNNRKQLRVFECFTKLINNSNSKYFNIFQHNDYVAMKCVNTLCELNYNITVKKFNEYDKYEFLKKIWKIHANNVKGLEVMALICLGYNINKSYIWNGILQQMVNLNMLDVLKTLIYLLSTKSELLSIKGLALAWEYVIWQPFKIAENKRSSQQDELLCKSIILLQSCPVTASIDMIELAERCIYLGCPYLSAILIRFTKSEQKQTIIDMVLKHKTDTLRTDIIDLEEYGVMSLITKYVINELEI